MGKGDILIVTHQRAALDQSDVCDSPFMTIQGAAKKSSPLMVFANFSAVVPEFKVKFATLV